MKPLILISNDDGVAAKGLQQLIEMLRPIANLFVVAPDRARSGMGCAITADVPIQPNLIRAEEDVTVYSCTGTPIDCVKLALDQLLQRMPDMIVSGINHGGNASINVHYSGTMGVVLEGAMKGIPSVAYSLMDTDPNADFGPLEPYILHFTQLVLQNQLPFGTCLNVNFPAVEQFAGVRVCRMGYGSWQEEYFPTEHPHGGRYYWLGGEFTNDEPDEEDTDNWALARDYVAITPVMVDVTDHRFLDTLKDWDL